MSLTNSAPGQLRSDPARTETSGIDSIQVAEVDITPGDIIRDYLPDSAARLEVVEINTEKVDTTTVRHIVFRNVDTDAQVNRTWRFAIGKQIVVGGPKLEQVRANPSAYERHLGRHIWKADAARKVAKAS